MVSVISCVRSSYEADVGFNHFVASFLLLWLKVLTPFLLCAAMG